MSNLTEQYLNALYDKWDLNVENKSSPKNAVKELVIPSIY